MTDAEDRVGMQVAERRFSLLQRAYEALTENLPQGEGEEHCRCPECDLMRELRAEGARKTP